MDSKMVKLNCLTLGELEMSLFSKKVECSFKAPNESPARHCFLDPAAAVFLTTPLLRFLCPVLPSPVNILILRIIFTHQGAAINMRGTEITFE